MTQADEVTPATGPGPEPRPAPTDASQSGPKAEPKPEAPQRESLIDALADLLQMTVNWLRAEAADIVRDKLVLPVQQLGMTLASAWAAATLLVFGLCFIAVALLLLLAKWLTWPGALGLIGVVLIVGAGVFTYLKVRSIQK